MYIFVRFAAVVMVILGILVMLAGVGALVFGLAANQSITQYVNEGLANTNVRVVNAGMAGSILGLALFLKGMILAALGQLMLVFVDISNQAKETNEILRSLRRSSATTDTTE